MSEVKVGEHDLLSFISPSSLIGAIAYLLLFVLAALVLSRLLRTAVHASMTRAGHLDRTTISFLQQILTALIWVPCSRLGRWPSAFGSAALSTSKRHGSSR
jgi:small conductance mechanosensitive channel